MQPQPQRIVYTLYTKDSASQSMRTKGALASFKVLEQFANVVGNDYEVSNTSVNASFWETKKGGIARAKQLIQEINIRLGKNDNETKASAFTLPSFSRSFEKYLSWDFNTDNLNDMLSFVDSLGTLSELEYRPPVYVSCHIALQLQHPNIQAHDAGIQSSIIAFLSPTSNTCSLILVTPYSEDGPEFKKFRSDIQKKCPINLLDKNFYIRKYNKDGEEFYRHLYPPAK